MFVVRLTLAGFLVDEEDPPDRMGIYTFPHARELVYGSEKNAYKS